MTSQEDFKRTFREGNRSTTSCLVLYFLDREDGAGVRIGFSVSKKVGNAVTRNRVKRRLKSLCSGVAQKIPPGYNLVFVARDVAAQCSYSGLAEAIKILVGKAGLLEESL